ncbi:LAME_0F04852g1_1 [Lachancea meyersii CBS 8951]|uniref:LAME_0F04852g1_1 n=1 Tax=Lachancea meyersii CBS 8951 TaxID=1266667 RepID=A0A1G4JS99_9SACH|nr:LAME_0F04852g1_1 [Lachancea meyersii CBS 8951]
MLKGSTPLKDNPTSSVDRTLPSLKVLKASQPDLESSPSAMLEDSTSLNDDLMSVHSSANKTDRLRFLSGRMSPESTSIRQSFDSSSVWGRQGRFNAAGNVMRSGSMEFSPLGNNSVYELVMNTRRKNWLKRPTTDDIPPVILSKNKVFDTWRENTSKYVEEVESDYAVFEHHNSLETAKGLGRLPLDETSDVKTDASEDETGHDRDEIIGSQGYGNIKRLPSFYFDEKFRLDDTRTFRKIVDDSDLHVDSLRSESLQNRSEAYQSIKQRLSEHLDSIENLLLAEISKSSNSFFFALEDVDKIKSKAADTIEKLNVISSGLAAVDRQHFQSLIMVLKKKVKRKNIEKLEQGLLQAKLVTELVSQCHSLFKENKYEECWKLIGHVENLLKGDDDNDKRIQQMTKKWPYKLSDLTSVPAFAQTREELQGMTTEIGAAFSNDFCDTLLEEIRTSYTPEVELGKGVIDSSFLRSSKKDAELADRIKNSAEKLVQCHELANAFQLYNDRFIAELKNIIKDFLPREQENNQDAYESSAESRSSGSGSKLSRLIRSLTPAEFQEMLIKIFVRENQALWRLSRHQKVLLDVALAAITDDSRQNVSSPETIMQLDINPAIHEGTRIVQLRMGKIIAVRRDINAKLRYDHFLRLCSVCFWFDRECENITGVFLTQYLKDVLAAQIKAYASTLNSQNAQSVRNAIDQEAWTPRVVEPEVQQNVNEIVSCVHMTPSSWTKLMDLVDKNEQDTVVPQSEAQDTEKAVSKGHKKSVVVNDKTFVASNALLEMIGMVRAVLVLSANLPSSFLVTFEKMCYDMVMYFNSRAMASVSVGPDNMPSTKSGKNLSILGESLDCLAELTAMVQMFYQRMSSNFRDYEAMAPETYMQLFKTFQASSEKLYQAHAPPPPI